MKDSIIRALYRYRLKNKGSIALEFYRVEERLKNNSIILTRPDLEIQNFIKKYINTNNLV